MITSTDNSVIRCAYGDIEALRMIKKAGFDGIDYTFYDMDPANDILDLDPDARAALAYDIRNTAEALGLCFPQCHAALKYKFGEGKDSKNYRDILASIEYAHLIGCPQIVIHSVRVPRNVHGLDPIAYNLDFMREFLPLAEKYDLIIGVENLFARDKKCGAFRGRNETPEKMNAFMDALGSDRFRVCCDLGHAAICGTEPEYFIEGMSAERMTMLHVQDTDYLDDRHWLPFLGQHNWDAVTSALAGIGFTGAMNLEVLHFYERFPKEMLQDALDLAAATARKLADMVEAKR